MTDSFFNREAPRDRNYSIPYAVYLVLRRRPWKSVAATTWNSVKRIFLFTLFTLSLSAVLAPIAAQARTYDVLSADVPFKFQIGDRAFRPGHYEFIFVGNGLLAVRDSHAHVIASLVTRSVEGSEPAATTKLVFEIRKKNHRLAEIRIQNSSQVLQVLGEEYAVRNSPAQPLSQSLNPSFSFSDRQDGIRLRH